MKHHTSEEIEEARQWVQSTINHEGDGEDTYHLRVLVAATARPTDKAIAEKMAFLSGQNDADGRAYALSIVQSPHCAQRDIVHAFFGTTSAAESTDKPSLIKCANCRTNMWDCYELCPNCMDDQTDSVTEEETDEPAA